MSCFTRAAFRPALDELTERRDSITRLIADLDGLFLRETGTPILELETPAAPEPETANTGGSKAPRLDGATDEKNGLCACQCGRPLSQAQIASNFRFLRGHKLKRKMDQKFRAPASIATPPKSATPQTGPKPLTAPPALPVPGSGRIAPARAYAKPHSPTLTYTTMIGAIKAAGRPVPIEDLAADAGVDLAVIYSVIAKNPTVFCIPRPRVCGLIEAGHQRIGILTPTALDAEQARHIAESKAEDEGK